MKSNLILHRGLYIREHTYDKSIVAEIQREYGWMDVKEKRVLDIGACFGGYTCLALQNGAKKVWAFEPELANFKLAQKNIEIQSSKNAILFNEAVVNDSKIDTLYLTHGINHGNFSVYSYRGRTPIKIKTRLYSEIIKDFKPQVMKIDCEGYEYELFLNNSLPSTLEAITLEYHFINPSTHNTKWLDDAKKLHALFKGWKVITQPKFSPTRWTTIAGYQRQ